MAKYLFWILLFVSEALLAQEVKIAHCVDGDCPLGTPTTNTLVAREIFALSNNRETKLADWVAYRVTRETMGTSDALERLWEEDDLLASRYTLEEEDYDGANRGISTDRGHQAPLASFAGTVFWRTTNILSNITPQKSALNRGPWLGLESAVREAAWDLRSVFVVTGPVYDEDEEQMQLPGSDERHKVPTGYFKVIADGRGGVAAFFYDQDTSGSRDDYCDGLSTLEEVESISGLTLFPSEPDWPDRSINRTLGCN